MHVCDLTFVRANECEPGGLDVLLKPPTLIKSIGKDGNCLFRALSYAVTVLRVSIFTYAAS